MKTYKEELEELRKEEAYEQHSVDCDMDESNGYIRRHKGCVASLDDRAVGFNQALDAVLPIIDKAVAEENYHTRAALHALGLMYMQYCAKAGHLFMSAGENAQSVLEYHGLLSADEIGRGEPNWDKLEALCFP